MQRMERRAARVSEAQWSILLDFLERNPDLARARRYNNTSRGRAESSRQWSEVAELLNAEVSGTTKTPKDWSVYVSNYKSKLKSIIAGLNRTGGVPPSGANLSDTELRFLSLMVQGFDQNAPAVAVNHLPDMDQKSTVAGMQQQTPGLGAEQLQDVVVIMTEDMGNTESGSSFGVDPLMETTAAASPGQTRSAPSPPNPADTARWPLPRRRRLSRYRSLARLDEARRVLSQLELQRAAADRATARANQLIGQNLGRLADAVERYLSHIGVPIGVNLMELFQVAVKWMMVIPDVRVMVCPSVTDIDT